MNAINLTAFQIRLMRTIEVKGNVCRLVNQCENTVQECNQLLQAGYISGATVARLTPAGRKALREQMAAIN